MQKQSRIIKTGMVTAEITKILDKLRDLYKNKTLIPRYDVSAMPENDLSDLLVKLNGYNANRSTREYYAAIQKFNKELNERIYTLDDKTLEDLCIYIKERRNSTSAFGVSLSTMMYIIDINADLQRFNKAMNRDNESKEDKAI